MSLLSIQSLNHYFGGLKAVSNFNIDLEEGSIYGLIGPNGAGKTTMFNLITGVHQLSEGKIIINGTDITSKPPHFIAKQGIARTFQNLRLFSRLTVRENIEVTHYNIFKRNADSKLIEYLLDMFKLKKYENHFSGELPYGIQRMVEISRALSIKPKLLLLDEPAAGMNPSEVDNLRDLTANILKEFDITILLIEHQMRMVMNLCHYITVMNFGEIIAQGTPKEIISNKNVAEAYLGKEAAG